MITIRPLKKEDFDDLETFYKNALKEEHENLIPKESIDNLLDEFNKDKDIYKHYWLENTDGKPFVAIDEHNKIVGFFAAKYFDSKESIIFYSTTIRSKIRDKLRDNFLKKLQEIFPGIKDIFIDVYAKNIEEVEFYKSRGFTIWDESTAPAGNAVLEVYLMQKICE